MEKDLRICPECGREVERADMYWTNDRYGIPFKLVCENCFEKVDAEIKGWVFDESYAGEHLEPQEWW